MPRPFHHPNAKDISLDGILHALADPVRRQIVDTLMGCPGMRCNKSCDKELSPSTLSFHYKVLREAGLVRSEKKGVEVINTLRKDDLEKHFPGLLHSIFQFDKSKKKK